MNKLFSKLLLLLSLIVSVPVTVAGCQLLPALPAIAAVVNDALVIMGIIDAAVTDYFRLHPTASAAVQQKYRELFTKAMHALNAAQHSIEGQKSLDQDDYDAAFIEFQRAFLELKAMLEKEGLMQSGFLKAGTGEVLIPEPEALTYKVR